MHMWTKVWDGLVNTSCHTVLDKIADSKRKTDGPDIVQWCKHLYGNQEVAGSSPTCTHTVVMAMGKRLKSPLSSPVTEMWLVATLRQLNRHVAGSLGEKGGSQMTKKLT